MLRLLDAFCCAGGASMGYHRAGFEVEGNDIAPHPRYPFRFHQGDAVEFIKEHGHEYDAIAASPPCQAYTNGTEASRRTNTRICGPPARHCSSKRQAVCHRERQGCAAG
jgi:DNA (cytosine-5)-methyltransferase 1